MINNTIVNWLILATNLYKMKRSLGFWGLVPFLDVLASDDLVTLVKYNLKCCQVKLFLAWLPRVDIYLDIYTSFSCFWFLSCVPRVCIPIFYFVGIVDPVLLKALKNEINPRQISIRNLILLAEAKEKKWGWFSSPSRLIYLLCIGFWETCVGPW